VPPFCRHLRIPFARYCVIGDRWAPGEHVLLLSRTRLLGDLVDIGASSRRSRERCEQLLVNTPALLGTFIAGAVLNYLPSSRWSRPCLWISAQRSKLTSKSI
jgi:hypothetical protein